MQNTGSSHDAAEPEQVVAQSNADQYVLRLYVTGLTPRSTQAIAALRELCREHLADRHDMEVIDLYEHPEVAKAKQLVAAPTLVRELPLPVRRLIGDLSDAQRVLVGLDLLKKPTS